MKTLAGCLLLALAIAAVLLLTTFAIILILRGRRGTSGVLSSAMLEVQSLLEPGRRQVREAMEEEPQEKEESGDPPSGTPE